MKYCAQQVVSFLEALKHHNDHLYGGWFGKGHSREDAVARPLLVEYSSVLQAFEAGVAETEFPRVSFGVGFWNGAPLEEESVALSFSLGSRETRRWTNHCLLKLGEAHVGQAFYATEANVIALKKLFIQAWKPEKLVLE